MATSFQDMKSFNIIDGELRGLIRFEKGQKWGPFPLTDCPSLEVTPDVMLTIGSKVYPKSLPSQCKNMRFLNLSPQATNANCCLHLTVGEFNHITLEITASAIEVHEPLRAHLIAAFSSSSANLNGIGENGSSSNINIALLFVTNKCPYCSVAFSKFETLEAHIRDYCATRRRITHAIMQDSHATASHPSAVLTQVKISTSQNSKPLSSHSSASSSMPLTFGNGLSTSGPTMGSLSTSSTPAPMTSNTSPIPLPQEILPFSSSSVATPLLQALIQSNAVGAFDWLKLLEGQTNFSSVNIRPPGCVAGKSVPSTLYSSCSNVSNVTTSSNTVVTSQPLSPNNPSTNTAVSNELLKYCSECDLFFTSNELFQWHLRLTPEYVSASINMSLNASPHSDSIPQQGSVISSSSNGIVRLCTHNCGILEIPMHPSSSSAAPHLSLFNKKSTVTTPSTSPLITCSNGPVPSVNLTPVNIATTGTTSAASTTSGNMFNIVASPSLTSTVNSNGTSSTISHPLFSNLNLLTSSGTPHNIHSQQQDQMLRILAAAARLNSSSFTSQRSQPHSSNGAVKRHAQSSQHHQRGHGNGMRDATSKNGSDSNPLEQQQTLVSSEPHVFPEKKYPCPFCEASFSHPDNLRAHRRYYCVPLDPLEESSNVSTVDEQQTDLSTRSSRPDDAILLQQMMKFDSATAASVSGSKRHGGIQCSEIPPNQSDGDSDHQDIIDVVSTPHDKSSAPLSYNATSSSPDGDEDIFDVPEERQKFVMNKRLKLSPRIHH